MKDIDDTREKTGISDLDDRTRKDLFNKFVDGGGEVASDREKRRTLQIDREKQKEHLRKIDSHKKNVRTVQKKKTISATQKPASHTEAGFAKLINRLRVKFNLKILRVSDFGTTVFNKKFLGSIDKTYKPALQDIQILYTDIFINSPANGKRIVQRLDKMKPIYFELIEMMGNVYNPTLFMENTNSIEISTVKLKDFKPQLMTLYKNLFLLKQYENTILNSFEKAIELQMKILDDKGSSYSLMKRNCKNNLFIIFHKLFPKLHWLLCHYENNLFEVGDKKIEEIFSIVESEKPGNRIANQIIQDTLSEQNRKEALDKEQENKEEIEEEELPDTIKKGMELQYSLDFTKLRAIYDKAGVFEGILNNDKILMLFLLFNEFDKEYSTVLTTNKIKYIVEFGVQGKMDYRVVLQDIYDEMRKSINSLNNYAEVHSTYEKARIDRPSSNSQYIQYSKRIESLEKKKKEAAEFARMNIKVFMEKVGEKLKILIDDMEGEQKYVANPQDVLEFNINLEGAKKLNAIKIYSAINAVYGYAMALAKRLEQGGDLAGNLEFKDTPENKKQQPNRAELKSEKNIDELSDGSLLDELDQLDDLL